jgi:hypothetical protein
MSRLKLRRTEKQAKVEAARKRAESKWIAYTTASRKADKAQAEWATAHIALMRAEDE